MGGHALKTVKSIRLPKDAFTSVMTYVTSKVENLGDIFVPLYSSDKMSFGDLDVIICPHQSDIVQFIEIIQGLFSPREVVKHASVISIDFNLKTFQNGTLINNHTMVTGDVEGGDSFQVDFILVSSHCFKVSCFYFSFNDFGAILGMMFKQWGFGFGSEGLFYEVFPQLDTSTTNNNNNSNNDSTSLKNRQSQLKLGRIYITTDVLEICQLAGLEPLYFFDLPNNQQHGGESSVTWNTIFEWLATSPLFHPLYWTNQSKCFNHDQRKRAEIRPMFRQFLFEFIPTHYPMVTVDNNNDDDDDNDENIKLPVVVGSTEVGESGDVICDTKISETVTTTASTTATTTTSASANKSKSKSSSISTAPKEITKTKIKFIPDEALHLFVQNTLHCFNKTQQVEDLIADYNLTRRAKEKFNGTLVSDITGLIDKELGMFMTKLRKEYSSTLGNYVWLASDDHSVEDITCLIIEANNNNK